MRSFKKEVLDFLEQNDFENNFKKIHKFEAKKLVNALFPFLYNTDKRIKDRTIMAMGEVISKIAKDDLDFARTIAPAYA